MKKKDKLETEFREACGREVLLLSFVLLILVLLGMAFCGCQTWPVEALNDELGVSDDNLVEEMIEEAIKAHTGLTFDLTPRSPE